MGIRDFIKAVSPPFLIGPGTPSVPLPATAGIAERYMYALVFGCDAILEKINEAIAMHFPGYGDASALPYTGEDRKIYRGLYDSDAAYAERLQMWLDTWKHAGLARGVIGAVAAYISPVAPGIYSALAGDNQSVFDSLADGSNWNDTPTTFHVSPPVWFWDNEPWPKRRWLVIESAGVASGITWAPSTKTWGVGNVWGDINFSWGWDLPSIVADDLRSLVQQWKGAGTRYPWIIITYGLFFAPSSGDYEYWSKVIGGTRPVRVPARSASARYISGVTS